MPLLTGKFPSLLTLGRKKGQPLEFVPKNPADEALTPDTSVRSAAEPPLESARSSWLGLAKGVRTPGTSL